MRRLMKNLFLDGLFTLATAPLRGVLWVMWRVEERKRQKRLERRLLRAHPEGTRGQK